MRQIGGWQTDSPKSFRGEGRGPEIRPRQHRRTRGIASRFQPGRSRSKVFGFAALLLVTAVGGSRGAGASPPATALPPFPGIAEAVAQFERLNAPGVTDTQKRLIVFEGALAVSRLPCTDELRADASRGVTMGCMQFGLLGRLQPVLTALDRAHPDRLAAAFGADVESVRAMLKLPTVAAQVAWGRSITNPNGGLVGLWTQEFAALASMPEFQSAYLESTTVRYRRAVAWAGYYGFRSQRGVAMMFDLALFRGIPSEKQAALVDAVNATGVQGDGETAELSRLRAFASARSDMEPNALLRFHLTTIAEGSTPFLGYALDLADFGITLDPAGTNVLP